MAEDEEEGERERKRKRKKRKEKKVGNKNQSSAHKKGEERQQLGDEALRFEHQSRIKEFAISVTNGGERCRYRRP